MTIKKLGLYTGAVIILVSALLVVPVPATEYTVAMHEYLNTNLPGSDYSTVAAATRADCAMACMFDTQCRAATWVHPANQTPSCLLKSAVPQAAPYPAGSTVMHSYIKEDITSATATVPAATGYGNLRVISVPEGAMVHIDEDPVGTTPVDLKSVMTGAHRVRISMAGYNDYIDDVTLNPGQMFELKVTMTKSTSGVTSQYTFMPLATIAASTYTTPDGSLKKALADLALTQAAGKDLPVAGTGTLIVSSNPAGASVYIDGKSEGRTPLTIHDVTAGQHNLLLTLQGFSDASRAVNVSAGSENQVAVDMTAAKKTPGFAAMTGALSIALLVLFRKRTG